MSITQTTVTGSSSVTDANSYTTASITPASNALMIVAICNTKVGGGDTPSLSGNGITWTQVQTVTHGTTHRITVFKGLNASPSTGVITISFGGVTQQNCGWSVTQFSNQDTDITRAVPQSAQNAASGTSLTVTLGSFLTTSDYTYGCFGLTVSTDTMTVGSGFTLIHNLVLTDGTAGINMLTEYKTSNDTSVDCSWISSHSSAGIALEIKAPPTANSTSLAGTLNSLSGVVGHIAQKVLSGAPTLSGIVLKSTTKIFAGIMGALTGTISSSKVKVQNLVGAMGTLSATLARLPKKSLGGSPDISGILTKQNMPLRLQGLISGLTGSPGATKFFQRAFSGAVGAVSGSVSFYTTRFHYAIMRSGNIIKRIIKGGNTE